MNPEQIVQLKNKEFRLESANMYLVNRDNSEFTIKGSGIVELISSGILQATLLTEQCNSKLMRKISEPYSSNKIIKEDAYFDLKLNDINGAHWISEKILINSWNPISISGYRFICKIRNIINVSTVDIKQSVFRFYISDKYEIPVNLYELFPNGGFSLNHRHIFFENINIKIQNHDKYYTICITDPDGTYSYDDAKQVLESISIAVGSDIQPISAEYYENGIYNEAIYKHSEIHLSPPIMSPRNEPWNNSFDNFLNAYLNSSKANMTKNLFYTWITIHNSYKFGFEMFVTTICIAIERLLKSNFEMFGLPDESTIREALDAKKNLKTNTVLSKRVQTVLESSLTNMCRFRAKTALHNLSKNNFITAEEIRAWNTIRNQTIHADKVSNKINDVQAIIDKTYICLNILYKLILTSIGYSGLYMNYSNKKNEVYFHHPFAIRENDKIQNLIRPFIDRRFLQVK